MHNDNNSLPSHHILPFHFLVVFSQFQRVQSRSTSKGMENGGTAQNGGKIENCEKLENGEKINGEKMENGSMDLKNMENGGNHLYETIEDPDEDYLFNGIEDLDDDDSANGVETFLESMPSMRFPSFHYIPVRDDLLSIPPAPESSLPLLGGKRLSSHAVLGHETLTRGSFQGSSLKLQTQSLELILWALPPLAAFSILGVIIRFYLEILFGPELANVTATNSPLFRDLPANMVGSFFMGWVGAVLKKDIAEFSELLAIGLSTGLMGSITTFAAWNQSMIVALTDGYWAQSLLGLLFGMELAQASFALGVVTAEGLQWTAARVNYKSKSFSLQVGTPQARSSHCQTSHLLFLLISGTLWAAAAALAVVDVYSSQRRKLWMACVVAPPGTWARWFLAQLNGKGIRIGKRRRLRWLPIGTLLTNTTAAAVEAGLALIQDMSGNQDIKLLMAALQFGFLGCMSTVSTFVAEVYLINKSPKRWKAFAYIFSTISISYITAILIYSSPVWYLKEHRKLGN